LTLSTTAKVSNTCDNVVVWSQRFGFDNDSDKLLIAAAPDLLLACKALLQTSHQTSWLHMENLAEDESCWCKSCARLYAKQAINKAQGE